VPLAFFPDRDGSLIAYNVQTATAVNMVPIGTCCTPAFDETTATLYVGDRSGVVHALNIGDLRKPTWSEPVSADGPGRPITTAITMDGRFLYFGMGNELWQFDLSTRQGKMCSGPAGGTFLTPVVSDGAVYAANEEDRSIHIYNAETCSPRPFIHIGDIPTAMPAVVDNVVYQSHEFGVTAYIFATEEEAAWLITPDPKRSLTRTKK
jgi:outer membrane protein assembly factor BamB